ncbi:MAG: Npun_F0494 family protein [Thermosynechococcaceae cyanobacterium]
MDYPRSTMTRAARAVACSPFKVELFGEMRSHSISLPAIAGQSGVSQHYTQRPLSEQKAESSLLWLVDVGLLRREVDGQGLTDSFRLTPLGQQLLQRWQQQHLPHPSLVDRWKNLWSRWGRWPV